MRTAPSLTGWSSEAWILGMLHEPDGDSRFGRTPFKEMMPSVDTPAKDAKPDQPFKPMSDADKKSVAVFLAAEGVEASDGAKAPDEKMRLAGETIVKERCTTCHLYKGEGDDGGQEYAPELSKYGSLAWTSAQIANPATKATYREKALDSDLKGHMPRFDADLRPEDIELLARWIHARTRGL